MPDEIIPASKRPRKLPAEATPKRPVDLLNEMILEDENGNVVPIPPMGPSRLTVEQLYGQLQASLLERIAWGKDWYDDLEMDQDTALAVCERTGMTPELWETKSKTERIPWLKKAITNSPLPVEASPVETLPEPKDGSAGKPSLDAQATALFIDDKSRTKTKIAGILGLKHDQSLSPKRCPNLDAAMRAWKARPEIGLRRGSKTDGKIEAVDE